MFTRKLLLSLVLNIAVNAVMSQGFDPRVALKWEGFGSSSKLSIINSGSRTIPSYGWRLYFNRNNFKVADSSVATVKHVNGDLFALAPAKAFRAIPAGDQVTLLLDAAPLKNITDHPEGFYFVWDELPGKGFDAVSYNVVPAAEVYHRDMEVAADVYRKNALIRTLKASELIPVFPSPLNYKAQAGNFIITDDCSIAADSELRGEAEALADLIASLGLTRPKLTNSFDKAAIAFRRRNSGAGKEAYQLQVRPSGIVIESSSATGAFYAVQSLKTAIMPEAWKGGQKRLAIPCMSVNDAPRFDQRMLMLDIARNFRSKREVLKVIDAMALYKLNKLHLHFSDDEGWRIEIPGLPELTGPGARRGHSSDDLDQLPPSYGSGASGTNVNGTGFYSKKDFIDMLIYAKERHIEIVPEIESPGHAHAAIKAMEARSRAMTRQGRPEAAGEYLLSDPADRSVYMSVQGWKDNVMNVAMPSTYRFLGKVIDELSGMYQEAGLVLNNIHMGGDEVPQGVWTASPRVDSLKKSNAAIRTTEDLWFYYFSRLSDLLDKRGINLSGWEEIGLTKSGQDLQRAVVPEKRFLDKGFYTHVWNNVPGSESLAYQLANAGYKVLLTNVTNFYFDLAANPSFFEHGQYWGGYVDVDKPYYFIPFNYYFNHREDKRGKPIDPRTLADKQPLLPEARKNIIGLQATAWSEVIKSDELLEQVLFPKVLALAERAWARDPEWAKQSDPLLMDKLYLAAYSEFMNRVAVRELPRLDHYSGGFRYRIPAPGLILKDGMVSLNSAYPGMTIRYTVTGKDPDGKSAIYRGPIPASAGLRFRVFNSNGRSSRTLRLQMPLSGRAD